MADGSFPPRSRSLGGCSTCRNRHIKCDETRPHCLVCQRLSLLCGGYEARVSFDNDSDNVKCRRPLYTDAERRSMIEALIASVAPKGTDLILSLLDTQCEEDFAVQSPNFEVIRGPFTAFRLHPKAVSVEEAEAVDVTAGAIHTLFSIPNEETCDLTFPPSGSPQGLPYIWSPLSPLSSFLQLDSASLPGTFGYHSSSEQDFAATLGSPLLSTSFLSSPNQSLIPEDAVFLLTHFTNTVVRFLSPPGHHKTLWHVSYAPSVMNTLAALTMGNLPNEPALCIFYAVLSITAYSLRGTNVNNKRFWHDKGDQFRIKAHKSLKLSLRKATSQIKFAKYKDILMSLLAMVMASVSAHCPGAIFARLPYHDHTTIEGFSCSILSVKKHLAGASRAKTDGMIITDVWSQLETHRMLHG